MDEQQKVRGPASYFPSIEKTYGQPIAHWLALLAGGSRIGAMALLPAGLGATLARGLPLAELVAGLLVLALAVPLFWNSL